MKKHLLLFIMFIMFMPVLVKAEDCDIDKITISAITIDTKQGSVEELDNATATGRTINLNLRVSEEGDTIKYKIVIKNESNEDYSLDKNSLNINTDYLDYKLISDDNNIVKANSSKTIYLQVQYKNTVPDELFQSGKYSDNQVMKLNLSTENNINNPNTGITTCLYLIIMVLVISGIIFVLIRKKKIILFIVLVVIIVPISAYAFCKCDININSKVEILNIKRFSLIDCETRYDVKYLNGMTFDEFYNSEYYQNTPSRFKESFLSWYNSSHSVLHYFPVSYYECNNYLENRDHASNPDCINDLDEIYVTGQNNSEHDSVILNNKDIMYDTPFMCEG